MRFFIKIDNRKIITVVLLVFVFGFLIISCNSSNDIVGIWKGSYSATQGITGLTFNVYNANDHYEAIFDFYNLPGETNAKEGKYYMYGSYNELTGRYNFIGYEWIKRPLYYIFVDLEGKITGNIFRGSVTRGSLAVGKETLENNPFTYREYYAKASGDIIEEQFIEEYTFRVVKKSKNILRELIKRIR